MSPDMPVPVPTPAAPTGFWANNSCRWTLHINVAFLVASVVVLYLIRTWKQERGCACKLKALEEERSKSRQSVPIRASPVEDHRPGDSQGPPGRYGP